MKSKSNWKEFKLTWLIIKLHTSPMMNQPNVVLEKDGKNPVKIAIMK